MIKKISTLGMSHEEWLQHRRNSIGGSDAATIVRLNPWSSPYELWADKLARIPPKEENEAMRIGHDLEEYVAKRFTEKTGKRVRRENSIIKNSLLPFAHANVDRMVIGEKAGLECKTTSVLNLRKFRDGDYPANYYVQCQHYMMVTGYEKWYLAVLVLGREFLTFEIARNSEDIDALAEAEKKFWEYVRKKEAPPVDGSASCADTISKIYVGNPDSGSVDLTVFQASIRARQKITAQIKELEHERSRYDNELKEYMQNSETGCCEGFRVSWRQQNRKTFDSKAFSAAHPEIDLSEYYKISTSRIFKIKEE